MINNSNNYLPVRIIGTGSYLPGSPIGPQDIDSVLGRIPGLPDALVSRTDRLGKVVLRRSGVRERYYALDPSTRLQTDTNVSMAEKAVRSALTEAEVPVGSIDLLIVASPMSDLACPPLSALLQGRLGITSCTEIEIHSNCTGTPKAIQIAFDMMRLGRYKRAVIVYTQLSSLFLRSEFFNPDKVTLENLVLRWILSDGAGALILDQKSGGLQIVATHVESIGGDLDPGMSGFMYGAFAHYFNIKNNKWLPQIHQNGTHHIQQDVDKVGKLAPLHLIDGLNRMLMSARIEAKGVKEFLLGIPGKHFVTDEMKDYFRRLIGVDPLPCLTYSSIEDFGYCGGATMLIQLDRLVKANALNKGDVAAAYLEESSKWMSGGFIVSQQ